MSSFDFYDPEFISSTISTDLRLLRSRNSGYEADSFSNQGNLSIGLVEPVSIAVRVEGGDVRHFCSAVDGVKLRNIEIVDKTYERDYVFGTIQAEISGYLLVVSEEEVNIELEEKTDRLVTPNGELWKADIDSSISNDSSGNQTTDESSIKTRKFSGNLGCAFATAIPAIFLFGPLAIIYGIPILLAIGLCFLILYPIFVLFGLFSFWLRKLFLRSSPWMIILLSVGIGVGVVALYSVLVPLFALLSIFQLITLFACLGLVLVVQRRPSAQHPLIMFLIRSVIVIVFVVLWSII